MLYSLSRNLDYMSIKVYNSRIKQHHLFQILPQPEQKLYQMERNCDIPEPAPRSFDRLQTKHIHTFVDILRVD